MASLMVFEMNGTDRRLTGDGGNTVKQLCPQGITNPSDSTFQIVQSANGAKYKVAAKIYGSGQTLDKIYIQLNRVSSPEGNITIGITLDDGGSPAVAWETSGTVSGTSLQTTLTWETIDVANYTLDKDTVYWVVVDATQIDNSGPTDAVYVGRADTATDKTGVWYFGYKEYVASWSSLDTNKALAFILEATDDSDYGLLAPDSQYGNDEDNFDSGVLGSLVQPQIKNDQITLYRTVLQIKPLDADWKATKDGDEEVYFISNTVDKLNENFMIIKILRKVMYMHFNFAAFPIYGRSVSNISHTRIFLIIDRYKNSIHTIDR